MADPRAFISKKTGKTKSSISTSAAINAISEARRALDPRNPVASRVGAGLRGLVSISRAISAGGKLPVSIDRIPSDVKWVLNQVGINSQAIFKVGQFNKTVASAGEAAAKAVFGKVSSGTFTTKDIPVYQPPLERLAELDQQVYTPKLPPMRDITVSPYAMDLFAFAPKYKFLFVVQFTFNAPYMQDSNFQRQFAFVVKKSTRPGVKYNQEDVNYYNFRTHVTTKAEFDEMSMSFYDDGKNNVNAFYTAYIRAMSPITNYSDPSQVNNLENEGLLNNTNNGAMEIPGIVGAMPYSQMSSGSTGPLAESNKTIINNIRLFQVFDYGRKVNIFNFYNPRITTLDLDDVDMSSSEVNTMDIKFVFESMYVDLDKPMQDVGLTDLTNQGLYPLRYNGDGTETGGDQWQKSVFGDTPPLDVNATGSVGNYGSVNAVGDEFIHPDMGRVILPDVKNSPSLGFDPRDINTIAPDYRPISTSQGQNYVAEESLTSMFGTKG
jgi:hypothetical protein